MIELRLWRSFVAVAEELNFRRAAERVGVSQPALTKQIQELEARIGLPLFRRESRGVEPTEATRACLEAARALLEQAQALEARFAETHRDARDHIRIGILEFFSRAYLPGVVQQMRAAFPAARITIVEMNTFETASAVADGRIELGLSRAPVTEQNVIARTYQRGRWLLVMPDDHELAAKPHVDVADLGDRPLIFFLRRLNPELFDSVMGAIEATGRRVELAYQTQDPMIGIEMAANGIGLCLGVSYLMDRVPDGLVARPVEGLGFEPKLDLVWRADHMTPALRFLIDAFIELGEARGPDAAPARPARRRPAAPPAGA